MIFRFSVLIQVTLDQRVLKIVLRSKVENACTFHKLFIDGHVVRAKPSAEAIKSHENWQNFEF